MKKFPEIDVEKFLQTLERYSEFKAYEIEQDTKLFVTDTRTQEEIHMEN